MDIQLTCEYCHTKLPLIEKKVTVYRKRKKQIYVIENVPARVCQNCGERYFSAEVVQAMDRLMSQPEAQQQRISVPVIGFAL
jgi:YgiT-type zinc finger domain-containing protein